MSGGNGSYPAAATLGYEQIAVGDIFEVERAFTREDVLSYAAVSGDYSPLHVDPVFAASTEFGACVVHGMLLGALFSQLVGMRVPGMRALYLGQDLIFRRPVFVGETVRAVAKVIAKNDATSALVLSTEIRSADGKIAVAGTAKVKIRGARPSRETQPTANVSTKRADSRPVALVTGASRGIGAEIALALAGKGYAVAVNYLRSPERAADVVARIKAAGGWAKGYPADVRNPGAVCEMVDAVSAQLGPPGVLVNGATGAYDQRAAVDLSWSDFLAHLEYQIKAVLQMCQAVYPIMKEQGGGSIINVASQVTGGVPPKQVADYVSAKYALAGMSKALAAEWADVRIRVNMVSPGLARTDLTEHFNERVFRGEALQTPLKRLVEPAEIGRAVAYLAGEDAKFITGINLFLSGGQVMV